MTALIAKRTFAEGTAVHCHNSLDLTSLLGPVLVWLNETSVEMKVVQLRSKLA